MIYAVSIRPQPVVPVEGSDRPFPVRRILCVGRNYAAHRREMGGDDRDPPFFFSKPADAVVPPGADAPYPTATSDLHHEIELVVALGEGGSIFGFAVGVDLTRRDLQAASKAKGQPWDAAKGFDASAPISAIRPFDGTIPQGSIALSVNGAIRQQARVAEMIWSVEEIIAEAGKLWALEPGDLIYTGTPEGVGALQRGDAVTGEVQGVGTIAFKVV
jgi:fumarylpyruvate hydrolase